MRSAAMEEEDEDEFAAELRSILGHKLVAHSDEWASSCSTALPTPADSRSQSCIGSSSGSRNQTPLEFMSSAAAPSGAALKAVRRLSQDPRTTGAANAWLKPPDGAKPTHKRPSTSMGIQQNSISIKEMTEPEKNDPNGDFMLWHLQHEQHQFANDSSGAYFFQQLRNHTQRYERLLANQKMKHEQELVANKRHCETRLVSPRQNHMAVMHRHRSAGQKLAALHDAALLRQVIAGWRVFTCAAIQEERSRAEYESRIERVSAVVGHLVEAAQVSKASEKAARKARWQAFDSGWQAAMLCQKSFSNWREAIIAQERDNIAQERDIIAQERDNMVQIADSLQAEVLALRRALQQACPESNHLTPEF